MKLGNIDIDLGTLSKSEKKVVDFLIKNVHRIPTLGIEEVATGSNVSVASVTRFTRAVGYSGFKAFKDHMKEFTIVTPARKMATVMDQSKDSGLLQKMMIKALENLESTITMIDPEAYAASVELISGARILYIYAPGPAIGLANILAFRMRRLDMCVRVMPQSGHILYEDLMNMNEKDVVLMFGFFNRLPEHQLLLAHKKMAGYKIILITDLLVSDMHDSSDAILFTDRGEHWDYHSMTAPLAVVEGLIIGVTHANEKRNMEKLRQLHDLRRHYSHIISR